MIRVAIADDHAVVREGLKRIIDNEARLELVGEAADGHEALKMLQAGNLDVLILDMSMPGRSGVELIKQIKAEKPNLPILVLSMHKEDEYAVRSIRAGAAGYLCKDSAAQQLLNAIRKVAAGGHFISPEIAGELAFGLIMHDERPAHSLLSDRELQIFRLIAAGGSGTDIAKSLNLSAKTVSTYKTRILQKMQLSSVVGATLDLNEVKRSLIIAPH